MQRNIRRLLILLVALIPGTLQSQVLLGTVTDSDYNPLIGASIDDTLSGSEVTCDLAGSFTMKITDGTILRISHPEYESKYFSISGKSVSDTLFLNFILTQKISLIPEVVINSKRMERVIDQKNTNVIDYLPFNDFILTIKSAKGKKFLSMDGQDTTFMKFDLGKIDEKSFVEDCFGHVHVVTKVSSYQIWIDSDFHIVASSSIKKFNELVKPCAANFSDRNVFFNFTNRNRKYTLTSITKETKQKDYFFHLHDKIGEGVARSYYWSIIRIYNMAMPDYANMIALGVWDGNLLTLNFSSPEFDAMVTWYLKIRAVELNIQAFQTDDKLVVFDQFSDSIHIFDAQNKPLKHLDYSFPKGSRIFDVLRDRHNNTFYEFSVKQGVYSISSINPVFETNSLRKHLTISEVPLAKNIQIFNDWVYFLVEENGFHGVYKIKIPVALDMHTGR